MKTDPRVTSFCIQKRINGAETIKRAPPKYFLHRETTALVSAVLLAVATVREAGLAALRTTPRPRLSHIRVHRACRLVCVCTPGKLLHAGSGHLDPGLSMSKCH